MERGGFTPTRGSEAMQRMALGQRVECGAARCGAEIRRERIGELEHDRRRAERLPALRLDGDVRQIQRALRAEQHLEERMTIALAWRDVAGSRRTPKIERARLIARRELALVEPDDA